MLQLLAKVAGWVNTIQYTVVLPKKALLGVMPLKVAPRLQLAPVAAS